MIDEDPLNSLSYLGPTRSVCAIRSVSQYVTDARLYRINGQRTLFSSRLPQRFRLLMQRVCLLFLDSITNLTAACSRRRIKRFRDLYYSPE